MKKIMTGIAAALAAIVISGCATPVPWGSIYTEVKMPVAASSNVTASKRGVSECKSILGIIAVGDASIETACRNGGITKIQHVDWEVENILGFIGKYRCVVYGE